MNDRISENEKSVKENSFEDASVDHKSVSDFKLENVKFEFALDAPELKHINSQKVENDDEYIKKKIQAKIKNYANYIN